MINWPNITRTFQRWANEGGYQVKFEETDSGQLIVTIIHDVGAGTAMTATLEDYRAEQFKQWLAAAREATAGGNDGE